MPKEIKESHPINAIIDAVQQLLAIDEVVKFFIPHDYFDGEPSEDINKELEEAKRHLNGLTINLDVQPFDGKDVASWGYSYTQENRFNITLNKHLLRSDLVDEPFKRYFLSRRYFSRNGTKIIPTHSCVVVGVQTTIHEIAHIKGRIGGAQITPEKQVFKSQTSRSYESGPFSLKYYFHFWL